MKKTNLTLRKLFALIIFWCMITFLFLAIIAMLLEASNKGEGLVSSVAYAEGTEYTQNSVEKNKVIEKTGVFVNGVEKVDPGLLYVRVIKGCLYTPYNKGCVYARTGPGEKYTAFYSVQINSLFEVTEIILNDNKEIWYKVRSDSDPKRTARGVWWDGWTTYKAGFLPITHVEEVYFPPEPEFDSNKKIIVDESEQTLYAYEGEKLVRKTLVSTGKYPRRTPKSKIGKPFKIREKVPVRYMQGSDYDLPGIGYTMYFTWGGAALHTAYWHNKFGSTRSHGCINQKYDDARWLYAWAATGTPVIVRY